MKVNIDCTFNILMRKNIPQKYVVGLHSHTSSKLTFTTTIRDVAILGHIILISSQPPAP